MLSEDLWKQTFKTLDPSVFYQITFYSCMQTVNEFLLEYSGKIQQVKVYKALVSGPLDALILVLVTI